MNLAQRVCRFGVWLLACWAAPAWANAVDVSLSGRALVGKDLPALSIHILEPIAGFRVKLQRSDGKRVELKGGGKPGVTRRLELPQPEGRFSYQGELVVNFPDASTSSMPLQFETELFGPLSLTMDKSDVDLSNRKVRFRLSRAAGKALVKVLMDTGEYALDGEVAFNGEPAQTPLEVTWPQREGRVMQISIQAFDTASFFTGVEIFPWQVDIPHEEVHFDSGKWNVRSSEEEKLAQSLRQIAGAVDKFGHLASLKLYIAGHTDSVGTSSSNRTLSLQRARSIGAYLRTKGLKIPIYYEGFGEEALLVRTSDETAEPKNRRAEYIIAVEAPSISGASFAASWQRL